MDWRKKQCQSGSPHFIYTCISDLFLLFGFLRVFLYQLIQIFRMLLEPFFKRSMCFLNQASKGNEKVRDHCLQENAFFLSEARAGIGLTAVDEYLESGTAWLRPLFWNGPQIPGQPPDGSRSWRDIRRYGLLEAVRRQNLPAVPD